VNPFSGNWKKPAVDPIKAKGIPVPEVPGAKKTAALTTTNKRRLLGAAVGGLAGAGLGGKQKGKRGALVGGLAGAALGAGAGDTYDRLRPVAAGPVSSWAQDLANRGADEFVHSGRRLKTERGQRALVNATSAVTARSSKPAYTSVDRTMHGHPRVAVFRHGDHLVANVTSDVLDSGGRASGVSVHQKRSIRGKGDLARFAEDAKATAEKYHPSHMGKSAGLASLAPIKAKGIPTPEVKKEEALAHASARHPSHVSVARGPLSAKKEGGVVTPKRALVAAALGATALKSREAIKNRRTDAKQVPGYATTQTARGLMSLAHAAPAVAAV